MISKRNDREEVFWEEFMENAENKLINIFLEMSRLRIDFYINKSIIHLSLLSIYLALYLLYSFLSFQVMLQTEWLH